MKKHPNLRGLLRLGLFLLGFALLLAFANTHLIQTDTIARMTLHEMRQRSDIELAFVGSSIVRDHFNAELITQETGMEAFCVTVPTASMPGSIALIRELFETNSPEWVVLVTEPYNLQSMREATEAQYKIMPFLSDPANMLDYYLRAADADGYYLDRLLMFREFGAQSLSDVCKTIALRYFPEQAYAHFEKTMDPTVSYQGRGFLRYETDERADDQFRDVRRKYTGYYYELFDETKDQLLLCRDLCQQNGANFMVVVYPNHTAHMLAEPDFLEYNDSLTKFCAEQSIACYNFACAKPELMPRLDDTFFDLYHMVGEGADALSRAFCRVFSAHLRGEDLSALFYRNRWEYRDAVDFITNCYLTQFDPSAPWDMAHEHDERRVRARAEAHDVFLADCNHGTFVTPEYKFVIRRGDGSEELLQDYGADTLYVCTKGALSGQTLRLYARVQGQADAAEVWYDLFIE